jgi:hypothetical protein
MTWPWRLAILHFVFLLGVFAGKPIVPYTSPDRWNLDDMVASRYFSYPAEAILTQAIAVIDFPALLLGGSTINLVATKYLHPVEASYVHAASWLLLGSFEWFLFGLLIDRVRQRRSG